jgi:hypothetical protein
MRRTGTEQLVLDKGGINQNLYYRWSKEFLEAGKKRPTVAIASATAS